MKRLAITMLPCAFLVSSLSISASSAEARPPDCQTSAYGCDYYYYGDSGNPGSGTTHVICDGEYVTSWYGPGGC